MLLLWLKLWRLAIRHRKRQQILGRGDAYQLILLLIQELSKLIILSIFKHLLLRLTKYFGKASHIILLMIIPYLSIFLHQVLPFILCIFNPFACDHPFLDFCLSPPPYLFLPLGPNIKQLDSIINQPLLDKHIKRRIHCEWRGIINLNNKGRQFLTQHDIKAQHLKAHIIIKILRMTTLLITTQRRITSYNSFNYHIINTLFYLLCVVIHLG